MFIFINNKRIEVSVTDVTILQLCENLGISIPRFCYHKELSIAGNCRVCMVEIGNIIKPVVACATSINKNMAIFTNSEFVKIARENVLELLLINHPLDCPICDQGGECDLQDQAMIYGSDRGRFYEIKRSVEDKDFGPIVKTVMTRCIHCTRCVRYADEIMGVNVLGMMGRGKDMELSGYIFMNFKHQMTGNITDICPVGALTLKPYAFRARPWELSSTELLDIFDSLGSNLAMHVKGNEVMRILPIRNDNLNKEWITDKARFFYEGITVNRLVFPLIKVDNTLIHCALRVAIVLYMQELLFSINSKECILSFIEENVDLVNSLLLLNYNNLINSSCLYIGNLINKEINIDNRKNWLLNSNIHDFINTKNMLLISINMDYECSVLNSLLYTNIISNENNIIYYIGSIFKSSYNLLHIGISNNTLRDIQKGKNEFCKKLINENIKFIESSVSPLIIFSVSDYINSLIYNNHSSSFITSNSTELNVCESGTSLYSTIESINEKKINFLHIFGNINNIIYNNAAFIIYLSHHMPNRNIYGYDIFLPIISFYEVSNESNMSLWLNNQLIGVKLFDLVISSVGESKTNEYYFNTFLKILSSEFNVDIDYNKKINLLLKTMDIYMSYKKTYISNDFFMINLSLFNNFILSKEILPLTFYKSDIFSINSQTLNTVYILKEMDLKKKYNYISF